MNRNEVAAWKKTVKYGAECGTCGLSEFGVARLKNLGFNMKPCVRCPDKIRKLLT